MLSARVEKSSSAKSHFLSPLHHPALTFPEKDLSIRAVVQDKAVTRLQGALSERVLCCHESNRHGSGSIGHLQGRMGRRMKELPSREKYRFSGD